jgi:hypothetical protein
MNETNSYGGEENLSFRQIVLNYMRKIMDLNLRVIPQENIIDYTKCYKRAVLGLSDSPTIYLKSRERALNRQFSYEVFYNTIKKEVLEE